MEIRGTYTKKESVMVEIEPKDCLIALIKKCGAPPSIYVKDGEFVTCEDISYHGSACYEYTKHDIPENNRKLLLRLLGVKEEMIKCGMAYPSNFQ